MPARKPPLTVMQWEMGAFVTNRELASVGEVAAAQGISAATARRHLNDLVARRLLEVRRARGGLGRLYAVPGTMRDV